MIIIIIIIIANKLKLREKIIHKFLLLENLKNNLGTK